MRVSTDDFVAAVHDAEQRLKHGMTLDIKNALALDLRDALAEVERLKVLSQSQSEALDLMENGKL